MEWYLALAAVAGSFLVLLIMGMPVAFAFLLVNMGGVILFWGGTAGLWQLILSIFSSVTTFAIIPVPMFVLIGEVVFHTGIAPRAITSLDQWLGKLPGRLSLLAVAGGTLFATLSGSSTAGVVTLGSILAPDMEKRGYKKAMSLGPILGSGGLSIMIPPSALGVLLACLAKISVGAILIAILVPGLLMAVLFAAYVVLRCWLQPSLAPSYEIAGIPISRKITDLMRYVAPLGIIVFLVLGVIFLGLATPTEAAAMGALGSFFLAAIYRALTWQAAKTALGTTLQVTVMLLMIFTGTGAFSQILAYTGSIQGLCNLITTLPLPPIMIMVGMQLLLLFMGTFMEPLAIMMVTLPIYMPIVDALGFNALWFGTIMLLNMEMATISPPFGLSLFAMKGVAPPGTTMKDIYMATVPFLILDVVVMIVIMIFPQLALWLPSKMGGG